MSTCPVKLNRGNWMMLEEWEGALLPPRVCYHKCAHPAISRVSVRPLSSDSSKPTSTTSPGAEQKGSNPAAALSTEAAEREGICPKATASLLCPKHTGKLSLPVAASHGSVPSCKPFTMLTTEKAAPSQFHWVSSLPDPVLLLYMRAFRPAWALHLYCAKLDLALAS